MAWMIVSDSSCEIRELKNPAPGVQFALVPFKIRVGEREYVDLATLNTQQMLQEMGAEEAEKRMADRKKQNFRRCRRIIRKKNGSKRNTVSKVSTKKHHSMTQTTAGHQS